MKLDGKVALITGAARGLGRGYAEGVLDRNGKVVIVDLLKDAGESTERELRDKYGDDRVLFIHTDVTERKQVEDAYEQAFAHFGQVDVVINNAGVHDNKGRKITFDVNIFAMMKSTDVAVAKMRTDKGGKGGVIINISSICGLYVYPGSPDYHGSKHAAMVYSRGLAALLGDDAGIRIAILCPGCVKTELTRPAWEAEERGQREKLRGLEAAGGWMPMSQVVAACMKCIENDDLPSGTPVKTIPTGDFIVNSEDMPTQPLF